MDKDITTIIESRKVFKESVGITYLDCIQRQPWNSCLKLSLARSNIIVIVKEPKETQNVGALTLLSMYFGRYHTHNVINGISWI
jgi:hypothetical protein